MPKNKDIPKISVIIPTYNRADLLSRTIRSVLDQTFRDFELIIVDDGSTDNTEEIVRKFQNQDNRIEYIYQKNSGGPARPKNVGIKKSKGKYIAFLDHDDEWLPNKLQYQIKLVNHSKKRNLGLVGCNVLVMNSDRNLLEIYKTPKFQSIFPELLVNNFIYSCSSVILFKSILESVGLFDENLKRADDWDMWIRLSNAGYDFDFVLKPLVKYYFHDLNLTKKLGKFRNVSEAEYIFKKHFKLYNRFNVHIRMLWRLGAEYSIAGDSEKGKKYLLKSINSNPRQLGAYSLSILQNLGKFGYFTTILFYRFHKFLQNYITKHEERDRL